MNMKIICLQENLKEGLNLIQGIVTKNNNLPILNNILLETEQGQLKISSTNLEIAIQSWVVGKIESEGKITIPAKTIVSYINNLPKEKITLTVKNQILFLKCGKYKAQIKGLPADDFPIIPQLEEKPLVKLPSKMIKESLSKIIPISSSSEWRPEISGVLFKFQNHQLKLVATDVSRLAEKTISNISEQKIDKEFILPQKSAYELMKILESKDDYFELTLNPNQVLFSLNKTQLVSRLIDGQYPDYQQIIPADFVYKVVANREELIKAINLSSIFSTKINDISLVFKPGENIIETCSENTELGENKSNLEADINSERNENLKIGFNFRFLLDGLNNIETEKVFLGLNNEESSVIIRPFNQLDYFYLVMPIKL
ncbi:MAG TPA: DNA polymerase III subunit beta [Candidatus Portnoybacteria bacterium]|nr:DNA polymerase III subunit beta [Candidatus Portnoybacteria bacterium]